MSERHDAPGPRQELLYDPELPTPTPAERARTLAETVPTGTLCTMAREPAGYPYGSFVTFAIDGGAPIFLLSEMAEHTKNLRGDDRASLLVAEPGDGDPLARGRVTLIGRCAVTEKSRDAYLAVHPNAKRFAGFKDFHFWRLEVEAVRWIGGYGRMSWVDREAWNGASADPLAPHAEGILAHMNQDHAEVMVFYCKAFSKATDTTRAVMTEVDRYGFEMSAETGEGPRPIRVAFSKPLSSPEEVRTEMVALARRARSIVTP